MSLILFCIFRRPFCLFVSIRFRLRVGSTLFFLHVNFNEILTIFQRRFVQVTHEHCDAWKTSFNSIGLRIIFSKEFADDMFFRFVFRRFARHVDGILTRFRRDIETSKCCYQSLTKPQKYLDEIPSNLLRGFSTEYARDVDAISLTFLRHVLAAFLHESWANRRRHFFVGVCLYVLHIIRKAVDKMSSNIELDISMTFLWGLDEISTTFGCNVVDSNLRSECWRNVEANDLSTTFDWNLPRSFNAIRKHVLRISSTCSRSIGHQLTTFRQSFHSTFAKHVVERSTKSRRNISATFREFRVDKHLL